MVRNTWSHDANINPNASVADRGSAINISPNNAVLSASNIMDIILSFQQLVACWCMYLRDESKIAARRIDDDNVTP
jgi:hypothetical protein